MDHLSSSQINLYLLCGLKYRYQYLDKLPKPFRSSALAFGSAFHSSLSWLHKQRMSGINTRLPQLLQIFDADWYSQKAEADIRYKEGEQEMALVGLGKELLTLYFREPHPKVNGTEVPFTIPLADPTTGETLDIDFTGFIDLVEDDGVIVEFKTSAQALGVSDIESRIQLTAYSYVYEFLHRKRPKGLKVVNFIKTKKPRMATLMTTRGKKDYVGFFLLAQEVLKGIRADIFFPHPGYWCKDCEYANVCPLWQGRNGGNGKQEAQK